MTNKELILAIRQALLMIVDVLERYIGHKPRTSTLRRLVKREKGVIDTEDL